MAFKTVVFVGAGCSKNFGYPLTGELLPRALEWAGNPQRRLFSGINKRPDEQEDEAFFLEALNRLLPGLAAQVARQRTCGHALTCSITDVLSLIDYSLEQGHHFGKGQSTAELRRLRRLVERAIFEVLFDNGEYTSEQEATLDRFFARIRKMTTPRSRVALISTNYDLALEAALFEDYAGRDGYPIERKVAAAVDLGMNWRSTETDRVYLRPVNPEWAVYKLHGSFNWLRCPVCQHLYVNVFSSITFQAYRRSLDENNSCDCGYGPLDSHLVAPSLVRDIRDPNLLDIWKHTQEVLRLAKTWYLIGYSFPTEDIAIRSMFLRAYHSRPKGLKPRVVVIQRSDESRDRYQLFFPDCEYVTNGWEPFLNGKV